jgi:aerobic C4-dicarboxylate transport protein
VGLFRHLKNLYVQVLIGVFAGVLIGAVWPEVAASLRPLGDLFIKLIRVVVAPVIFCTVVAGIARMHDLKSVGKVGLKTLVYFEVVSTFALVVGFIVTEIIRPGAGFDIDPASLDPAVAAGYVKTAAASHGGWDFVLSLVPDTFVGAFAQGNLLQVLLIAVLTGFACMRMGEFGYKTAEFFDHAAHLFFGLIHIIVRLAPLGAFGAMAFTIGKYGLASLAHLGALVATFYITSLLFVLVVLGAIAALAGFSIFRFLAYIREELLICFATSSSESVLPLMIEKMQRLGASQQVVGLVLPTGYSFNLDGTNIYLALAILFLAQALNIHLTLAQELSILAVAMLTSKGAAAVTGGGFITLAATLAVTPDIPVTAMALLVGVDRFMSECRALTNLCGNGVAALVIARWENQLDRGKMAAELRAGGGILQIAKESDAAKV